VRRVLLVKRVVYNLDEKECSDEFNCCKPLAWTDLMRVFNVFATAISLVFATLFSCATVAGSPTPSIKALKVDDPKRILFVGNSYLYYNNSLHSDVLRMVFAAGSHSTKGLIYKSATISRAALFRPRHQ
jgi:hypothetical protein